MVPSRGHWLVLALCLFLSMLSIGLLPARPAQAAGAQVVSRFTTSEPMVALTFDAGSDRGFATQILDTLKANGIHASFGMTGLWAQQNPDLVKRMVSEGHVLINHSWDHPDFTTISSAERISQLQRTDDLIRSLTGTTTVPFFRPPFGAYNQSVLDDVAASGYQYSIMWTVDTLGWNGASVSEIRQRVVAGATPGEIVLMHVGEASQDAAALQGVIDDLRSRGYRFGTVRNFLGNTSPDQIFFPQTGHYLSHGMLRYWQTYGGLPVFGYPISEEFIENGVVVQYFERARLEWHPGAWPSRYDILLGRLGSELTVGRQNDAAFRPVQASTDANCTFYPATGHRLCFGFRDYWTRNGGLATFGYPISEEFAENGVVVQYFERQRLEFHPTNPPAWQVLGGLVGRQRYEQLY
jgi:peptidoglycan/xylan/chitin deacetylase (PgdA/CDA1 family)